MCACGAIGDNYEQSAEVEPTSSHLIYATVGIKPLDIFAAGLCDMGIADISFNGSMNLFQPRHERGAHIGVIADELLTTSMCGADSGLDMFTAWWHPRSD